MGMEGYKPSAEEIKEAENNMTSADKSSSEYREQYQNPKQLRAVVEDMIRNSGGYEKFAPFEELLKRFLNHYDSKLDISKEKLLDAVFAHLKEKVLDNDK